MTVEDCLVLRIEETDGCGDKDNIVYVLYDSYERTFLIRGKRATFSKSKSNAFSFETPYAGSVKKFISFLIPPQSVCTFELYRYGNLPADKNVITYDTLADGRNVRNELVAYENRSSKKIRKILNILRDVSNEYVPEYDEN